MKSIHQHNGLLLLLVVIILSSCGYKGEEIPDFLPEETSDTVFNDLTYTAVTGNVSAVGAVAVTLHGYANTSARIADTFDEQGFLISRYKENLSFADAENSSENTRECVVKIQVDAESIGDDNRMTVRYHGLIPSCKFYYRAFVVRKNGEIVHGVVKTFMSSEMDITISPAPDQVTLMDALISAVPQGYATGDYGQSSKIFFSCQDVSHDSVSLSPIYSRVQESTTGDVQNRYYSRFHDLIPGAKYFVRAYIEITSPFYVYDEDNGRNSNTGDWLYGSTAEDIRRYRYMTAELPFWTTQLTGVAAFTSEDYEIDYDVIDITDNYYVLPSDTITIQECGVALIEYSQPDSSRIYTYYPSDTPIRSGNRFDVRITNLQLKRDYDYVAYVVIRGLYFISSSVRSFATKDYTPIAVDMGTSVLWADRNIGAWSPEISGSYYAWGEYTVKREYTFDNYTSVPYSVVSIADSEYDVAKIKWADGWRMPTRAEIEELCENCSWTYGTLEGQKGFFVNAFNDNTLFFPFGGHYIDSRLLGKGEDGYYWTAERDESSNPERDYGDTRTPASVHYLYLINGSLFGEDAASPFRSGQASNGLNVRPVKDK